ncbi:hypothetical protein SK128_014273 [Halocaridina rubra]|uniref:Uncharacterized protein n=1 Tax=Halocaridina rubra TaxID=373956 RepID=A0AAN8WWW3_HALRR
MTQPRGKSLGVIKETVGLKQGVEERRKPFPDVIPVFTMTQPKGRVHGNKRNSGSQTRGRRKKRPFPDVIPIFTMMYPRGRRAQRLKEKQRVTNKGPKKEETLSRCNSSFHDHVTKRKESSEVERETVGHKQGAEDEVEEGIMAGKGKISYGKKRPFPDVIPIFTMILFTSSITVRQICRFPLEENANTRPTVCQYR